MSNDVFVSIYYEFLALVDAAKNLLPKLNGPLTLAVAVSLA